MAKNTDNKRIAVKHVRDKAKSAYEKSDHCCICDGREDLELHHTHSITILLNDWAHKKGYDISTDAGILEVRDEFIEHHHKQIYEDVYTLCNRHHVKLHSIYGKAPATHSAPKQTLWIQKQREKFIQGETGIKTIATAGTFAQFY